MVFTHWPIDNHADHRAISMLVYDAWLQDEEGVRTLLLRGLQRRRHGAVRADPLRRTSPSTEPRKRQACYAHASQSPTNTIPFRSRSPGCAGSRAAIGRPKPTSATSRAPTSRCRWHDHAHCRVFPVHLSAPAVVEREQPPAVVGIPELDAGATGGDRLSCRLNANVRDAPFSVRLMTLRSALWEFAGPIPVHRFTGGPRS